MGRIKVVEVMSAYGQQPRERSAPLTPLLYTLAEPAEKDGTTYTHMICVHVPDGKVPPALEEALRANFNETIEQGDTYPFERTMDRDAFEGYFFAYDVVVGILVEPKVASEDGSEVLLADVLDAPHSASLYDLLSTIAWPAQLGGYYYVKPNYPGRSSHICNAGFVVPTASRGLRLGSVLGRSYLRVAPALGYLASVFNLVYETNQASAKIWERLGFEVVGRVPKAGLLRLPNVDGGGFHDAYVDALIIYKAFAAHAEPKEEISQV